MRATLLTAFEAGQSDLPFFGGDKDPDYYGEDDEIRFAECWGDNNSVRENEYLKSDHPEKYHCSVCYAPLASDQLDELSNGKLVAVPHLKLMPLGEQARAHIEQIADMFDLDIGTIGYPNQRAEDAAQRAGNVDVAVALGLQMIASGLTARGSNAQAAKRVRELSGLHLDTDDHPFFTEATLYELLGKDNARTVLAYIRQVKEAVAAS